MQNTIKQSVKFEGIGLHSGLAVRVTVHPAAPDTGIVFRLSGQNKTLIPARWGHVIDTRLCTVIGNQSGDSVATIEHLMAALRGLWIDNAIVEIDGREVPILDGSSQIFVEGLEAVGIQSQSKPRKAIKILKTVTYQDGDKYAALSPSSVPTYRAEIDYKNPFIGRQAHDFKLLNGNFKHDLADCRTFCLLEDVEAMQAQGLARGGSLENAVVVSDQGIMNSEGLRCHNEFSRHKILDAVGDLALADGLIIGAYSGLRAGHMMNNRLLHALYQNPDSFEVIDLYVDMTEQDQAVYHKEAVRSGTFA